MQSSAIYRLNKKISKSYSIWEMAEDLFFRSPVNAYAVPAIKVNNPIGAATKRSTIWIAVNPLPGKEPSS